MPRGLVIGGFSLAVLGGVGVAKTGVSVGVWVVIALAILCGVSLRRQQATAVILAVMLGATLGVCRGGAVEQRVRAYEPLFDQKVVVVGVAASDAVYGKNAQLSFTMSNVQLQEPKTRELIGTISVSGFGAPMVYRGDTVKVSGKMRSTLGSNQARMSFAQLEVLGSHPTWVDAVRRKFATGLQNALPEPLASFGIGILIGQRSTLPDDVAEQLKMVGLVHIIAVSGYNVTILIRAARRVFARFSKFQTTCAFVALIGVFLLLTGQSPSIVRASVVATIGIATWYYGRRMHPVTVLLLAAAITALMNPIFIWQDAGWWLSFLAFFGVLVLSPLVIKRIFKGKEPHALMQIAIDSFCAEIMTIPFVLFAFGQMSLVALVANVLVVAFVPFAMLLSLVAGLAGMFVPFLAGWFAWPARILMTYMLDVAGLLSRIPGVFVEKIVFPLQCMLAAYALVFVVVAIMWFKTTAKYGRITDKNPI